MSDLIQESYMTNAYLNMSEQLYHSDPCPEPSLSASIAKILHTQTPRHAYLKHPKLGKSGFSTSARFDLGRAAHSMLLEPEKENVIAVDSENWRCKETKLRRDEIHAQGKIPMLIEEYSKIELMASIARDFIRRTSISEKFFASDKEVSLIAKDGCWLRGRLDAISKDRTLIIDYKTVPSANPDSFLRSSVFQYGYDIQAAMYIYLNKLTGHKGKCTYMFVLQEIEAPYSCSLVQCDQSIIDCGSIKLGSSINQWSRCLADNEWPEYGHEPYNIEAPAWRLDDFEMLKFN